MSNIVLKRIDEPITTYNYRGYDGVRVWTPIDFRQIFGNGIRYELGSASATADYAYFQDQQDFSIEAAVLLLKNEES